MKIGQTATISWWSVIALSIACAAFGVVLLVAGSTIGTVPILLAVSAAATTVRNLRQSKPHRNATSE